MTRFLNIFSILMISASGASAYTNVLDNGDEQYVDSVWSTNLPLIVGNTTSNNFMAVVNGGYITNATSIIGNSAAASNNAVVVFSDDAAWVTAGNLKIGNGGSANWMTVTNGGTVISQNAYIGNSNSASLNHVLVTGDGSSFSAVNDLVVGGSGSHNSLYVVAGGSVSNANGFVGTQAGATNNKVYVVGGKSTWVNEGALTIGASGNSSNEVYVQSYGTVEAADLVVHAGNSFNLNTGGVLRITEDFDLSVQTNLNWITQGTLSVGGNLTGIDNLDGTNLYLTIDGGTWTL